ncbi:MAG: HNH endonuclease [Minwuia sp.]|uniref:HNH endonuclease n=1 Tax=Minwuia sp. TaxID=2493630 RepID=UPI003A8C4372
MGFCVFMHRSDSIYEDRPEVQYQFPKQYLGRAQTAEGDWIIYLEPSKVRATRGYFAIARVKEIIPDPGARDMYLALIEPGSYLDFAQPVPFNEDDGPIERGLLNNEGRISGRAQAAVRPISPSDFNRILDAGLDEAKPTLPRLDTDYQPSHLEEQQAPFEFEAERARVESRTNRLVRDRVFRRRVLQVYDERCAFTGLKLINGGGRAEVNAAHIKPVADGGPDSIQNGLGLSGTVHWMFDRGLISLADDFEILISRQVNDVDSIKGLINKDGRAWHPPRVPDRPHPRFLEWHRTNCFKG